MIGDAEAVLPLGGLGRQISEGGKLRKKIKIGVFSGASRKRN
jgi:hypothetical protein